MNSIIRVDSHQHFWLLEKGYYTWLQEEPERINHDFLPENLTPLLKQSGVSKTVIVQAAEAEAETDYILQLADENEFVAGVVGWVDMDNPSSIHKLTAFSKHPKFLGIRPIIQGIEDVDWMLKPSLDIYFNWLIENDYTFDALVKPQHLNNLKILLQRYPTLKVVIDHCAKPDISVGGGLNVAGDSLVWADNMSELAANSQAYCKLSGIITEAGINLADSELSYDQFSPYINHLYKSFGAKRLMWGSDWPVCTLAAGYQAWVGLCERFVNNLPQNEQEWIWGRTVDQFYNLKLGFK